MQLTYDETRDAHYIKETDREELNTVLTGINLKDIVSPSKGSVPQSNDIAKRKEMDQDQFIVVVQNEQEPESILEIPATQVKKEILLYKASARESKSSSSSLENNNETEIKVYIEQEVQKIKTARSPILTPKSSSIGSPLSSR